MIALHAAHQCALENTNIFAGILAAFGIAGLAIGVLGYFAPRHWLIANFTRFRDIDERARADVRETLGIEDAARRVGA